MKQTLGAICYPLPTRIDSSFPEVSDAQGLKLLGPSNSVRIPNLDVWQTCHNRSIEDCRPGRGARTFSQQSRNELKELDSLQANEANIAALLNYIVNGAVHVSGSMATAERRYDQHHGMRTRRYVHGFGAQKLSTEHTEMVCPRTVDFVICTCAFIVLPQRQIGTPKHT